MLLNYMPIFRDLNECRHKSIFLLVNPKKENLFCFLRCGLIVSIALFSCACSEERFESGFDGLLDGTGTLNNCVSFSDYSVTLKKEEAHHLFEVFSGKKCLSRKKQYSGSLSAGSKVMGEWHGLIVIDQAAVHASRNIVLFDPISKYDVFKITYVDRPFFGNGVIEFYSPTGMQASAATCESQKQDYMRWKGLQYDVEIAAKKRYVYTKNQVVRLGEKKCMPLK